MDERCRRAAAPDSLDEWLAAPGVQDYTIFEEDEERAEFEEWSQ